MDASTQGDGEEAHGAEFAESKDGDKGERIHAAEIGLAIRAVHGPPQNAGAEGRENSGDGALGGGCGDLEGREPEHDGGDDDGGGSAEDAGPVGCASAAQFVEEEPSPEEADETVGVPERK